MISPLRTALELKDKLWRQQLLNASLPHLLSLYGRHNNDRCNPTVDHNMALPSDRLNHSHNCFACIQFLAKYLSSNWMFVSDPISCLSSEVFTHWGLLCSWPTRALYPVGWVADVRQPLCFCLYSTYLCPIRGHRVSIMVSKESPRAQKRIKVKCSFCYHFFWTFLPSFILHIIIIVYLLLLNPRLVWEW